MNFLTNINTIFEIHDPKKLKFLKKKFERIICLIFLIKKTPLFFLKVWKWSTYDQLYLLASEAPSSSISKHQKISFKPGHFYAKILVFTTHRTDTRIDHLISLRLTVINFYRRSLVFLVGQLVFKGSKTRHFIIKFYSYKCLMTLHLL